MISPDALPLLKTRCEQLDTWMSTNPTNCIAYVSIKVLRTHLGDLIRGRGSKKHALLALKQAEVEFENARRLAA